MDAPPHLCHKLAGAQVVRDEHGDDARAKHEVQHGLAARQARMQPQRAEVDVHQVLQRRPAAHGHAQGPADAAVGAVGRHQEAAGHLRGLALRSNEGDAGVAALLLQQLACEPCAHMMEDKMRSTGMAREQQRACESDTAMRTLSSDWATAVTCCPKRTRPRASGAVALTSSSGSRRCCDRCATGSGLTAGVLALSWPWRGAKVACISFASTSHWHGDMTSANSNEEHACGGRAVQPPRLEVVHLAKDVAGEALAVEEPAPVGQGRARGRHARRQRGGVAARAHLPEDFHGAVVDEVRLPSTCTITRSSTVSGGCPLMHARAGYLGSYWFHAACKQQL